MASFHPEIPKESLGNYHFPKHEVLTSSAARESRSTLLSEAQRLGNEFKTKVRIGFMTTEGMREVVTTVWSVADDVVMFKSGNFIPIHSISYLEKF